MQIQFQQWVHLTPFGKVMLRTQMIHTDDHVEIEMLQHCWWGCLLLPSIMGIRMERTPKTQNGPAVPMPTHSLLKTLLSTQTMVYLGAWKSLFQVPVAIYWLCFLVLYSTFAGLTVLDSHKAQSYPYASPGETLIFFGTLSYGPSV